MEKIVKKNLISELFNERLNINKSIIFDSKLIIYGAGSTGERILSLLEKYGISIDYFLDEKGGNNRFINNIPILKPDDPKVDHTAKVIIGIFNHITDVQPIFSLLKKIGFKEIIPYTYLFLNFFDELPEHYWLGSIQKIECNIPNIASVYDMLEDEISKKLLLSIIRFRITGNPFYMPPHSAEDIYFPKDIFHTRKPEIFIDCGAFDGDTLDLIKHRFGNIKSIRAFEPDIENFHKLVTKSQELCLSDDIALFPCGVWSFTTQLHFSSQGSPSSCYAPEGKTIIQCVSLDDCLVNYSPVLIKMDIEGSELEALGGCKNMITQSKPDLAISVYHRPDHLWTIPLFIEQLTPGYKYYLRSHGANGYDTVFYAYRK